MLAIIDYGSGNLRSALKACERVATQKIIVTQSPKDIANASHIILPGVGAFADCMRGLTALPGMLPTLQEEVIQKKKMFLGICVGMQMLFETGHEHGVHKGLGWLKGEVVPLSQQPTTNNQQLKIPHMGWNELNISGDHPLMRGIEPGAHAYFVHSYAAECKNPADVIATTDYGQKITAVVAKDNIMGTQFHPEKSQDVGLRLLKNFVSL